MSVDPILDAYLGALDRSLEGMSPTEKAEIITQLKNQVMEAQKKGQAIGEILTDLGEPEIVANGYRLSKGLKPVTKDKDFSLLKWLTIGFLGTVALSVLAISILVWKFTPLISIDEDRGRMTLLGGAIDIDSESGDFEDNFQWSFNSGGRQTSILNKKSWQHELSDEKTLSAGENIEVLFSNGNLAIEPSVNEALHWQCQYNGVQEGAFTADEEKKFVLNFESSEDIKCLLLVPAKTKLIVKGENGRIKIQDPLSPYDIDLKNGKVKIAIDEGNAKKYSFDLYVGNGTVGDFTFSADKNAILLKVSVANGMIR